MASLPAVGDPGQEFTDTFDICIAPRANLEGTNHCGFRRRYLLRRDILGQGGRWQAQFLGSLASGVALHLEQCSIYELSCQEVYLLSAISELVKHVASM